MRNTTARALLRQSFARHELGRVHDVARPSFRASSPEVSQHVRPISVHRISHPVIGDLRAFAFYTTTVTCKSKSSRASGPRGRHTKTNKMREEEEPAAESVHEDDGPKHPQPNPEDPLDFADVASRMQRHESHYRESLMKLKSGGRFNPDIVGGLRVQPDRKTPGVTYPLREMAQVIPRGGRTISLIAHEEAYVKPIMSAVQASADFNQQPQRDPDNELELILKIEPERRDDLLKRVKALCNGWRDRVRSIRQRRDKLHDAWRKNRSITSDMRRMIDKELEKVIKAKMSEIDDAEKEGLRAAEAR
ncbi:ribosome recycling factor [Hypoxylon crocopeplum]|nr:ribosome recycling factor [Hypoxylon crocopeplum]